MWTVTTSFLYSICDLENDFTKQFQFHILLDTKNHISYTPAACAIMLTFIFIVNVDLR